MSGRCGFGVGMFLEGILCDVFMVVCFFGRGLGWGVRCEFGEMAGVVRDAKVKADLDNAVKKAGSVVVVHFWASWCEPSVAIEPLLAQLAAETPQAQFFRVSDSLVQLLHRCLQLSITRSTSVFLSAGEVIQICLLPEQVEAEEQSDITEEYEIEAVPFFIWIKVRLHY